MPSFAQNLLQLPARSKAIIAVSAAAILLIAFMGLKMASAPSYTLLSTGLDPAQTGKITAALDAQGIGYELRNNGTALAVEKAQAPQAQVALASQGVSVSAGAAGAGYELFDKQKLGASQFQQQVTYQRALEGEIARTIGAVQGVSSPQVQLVLPQEDLFASSSSPATAAVMLGNPASTLQPGAVPGIAQLVASSVKGLKLDNVTITDASGQLLWPNADGAAGGMASSKQALEARYATQMESNLNALLAQTLGPGKAQVQVTADLNADKTSKQTLTYAKKGVPLKTSKESEQLRGGSVRAGGTAGTGSNIPSYSQGAAAANGNSSYKRSGGTTEWGVDKQVAKTDVAPGAINTQHVALLVDSAVPPAVFNSLKGTIASAAGINTRRGDQFQATQVPFAKPAVPKTGPVPTTLLGPLKWVAIGLATLLFLFFVSRGLRKREGEALAQPGWLTQIEEPVSLAELEQQTQLLEPPAAPTALPPRVPDAGLHALDQLMDREPERVAAQVKAWMADD
jgi:flagellar M-ring protein FliF